MSKGGRRSPGTCSEDTELCGAAKGEGLASGRGNPKHKPPDTWALGTGSRSVPQPAAGAGLTSFKERMRLCSILHAFRIRTELGTLGFECTLEEVDLEDITRNQINTIKACTAEDPGIGNCPALEGSTFDTRKCLQGIYEDLNAYRAELKNFNDPKVLASIDEMMKALGTGSRSVPQPAAGAGLTSFKERMRLCSILHAFRIRTVTINRMMNYLTSPESSL
ncbi:interleukin-12 subunit alpha [Athene cunicularia]|uniref:interleukin-12 subunit alpha n=1 Tax=Athene cunicularia TaxID=194338 RepID=UPI000EF6DAD0|nr:interleukin-12 subunit alpha [Athene cunicularia]